jgi:Spherulation-specific family 4
MTSATGSRRGWIAASTLAAGAALVVTFLLTRGAERRPVCRSTLIPAYVPPAGIADVVGRSARPRLVVINPHNGPGAQRSAELADAVRAARKAGTRVLAYVPTGYGSRPASAVTADLARYAAWYRLDGVFLDEASSDAAHLPYYAALARRARGEGQRLVALNAGVVPARGYFRVADVVVTFEGPYAAYDAAMRRAPAWVGRVPRSRVAHLVYAATREQALDAIAHPAAAGYLYVTSGTAPDPWRTLPAYLHEEEEALARCA